MAHQDETTESGIAPDDCFDDPQIEETASSAATSDAAAERRLTVLSRTSSSDSGTDASVEADWFDDDGTARVVPSILLDPENGGAVRIDRDSGEPIPHTGAERRSLAPDPDSFDSRTARLRDHRTATSTAPVQRSWWRRHRAAVAVAAAASLLLGGIGAAALWATDSNSENPTPQTLALDEIVTTTAVPTSTLPAAAGAAAADVTWCTGQADGQPVTEDSADPGAAAIWRFEKAFYYDRNGAAARAAGAPDAVMASAQRLQQGIDQLEPDIEFCVLADPVDAGVYNVTVVERGPGIDGRMSRQRITTAAQPDGQTLITAIVPR